MPTAPTPALRTTSRTPGSAETLGSAVTRDEVRAAILWAIDHDQAVLAQHRQVAHTVMSESQRRSSDADLVAHWRSATTQTARG